ncbi:alpha/beta hydrolase [Paraburkholderia oxyphila]|uniref:alpha/beta hydrolase n=1 Tax=Paraburkholderia oxyphila TaxID=614212 RepID=UPI00048695EA|nr:alpha/beta hydrolase [Paraburkholderia oxyphila]
MQKHYPLSDAMREFVATSGRFVAADDSVKAMRDAYDALCRYFTPERDAGLAIEEQAIAGSDRHIPVRIYRPLGEAPAQGWPCVLYLHGGGWVVGGLDSHEFITAPLARDLSAVVVVVDYRLAPEHVFPAAFDDCLAAWRHLQSQGEAWGIDTSRVVVAGDSAGGNLAAALCLEIARMGGGAPLGQALIYPGLGTDHSLPSFRDNADAPLLSTADVAYFLRVYAPDPASHNDPRLAPLAAPSLGGLPPAFVAVAEFDPLRDDGQLYAERLRAAGVPAQFHLGRGLLHGCMRAMARCPETARLYEAFVKAIAAMLASPRA